MTSPRLECVLRCAGSSDISAGAGVPGVALLLLLPQKVQWYTGRTIITLLVIILLFCLQASFGTHKA